MGSWSTFGERPGFVPGVLSFCLPGLGQLYQRRVPVALVCFCAFAVPMANRPGYPYPLLIAVLAGAEAFWRGQKGPRIEGPSSRRTAYTACGILAFALWSWFVSPAALPLRRQAQANARADALARELKACSKGNQARMRACLPSPALRQDPWGNDWSVVWDDEGVTLRSAGPDRTPGTRDDLRYRYRIR